MNNLWTDTGYVSINKNGEQLCGDKVEIIGTADDCLTLVLADGLGSGVKANILSTLTSKILCTMIDAGMSIEDCVDTIVKTLPVCQVRKVAYSTFTIIHIEHNDTARIIQFDNPNVIFLRDGKSVDYPIVSRMIGDKTVLESTVSLQLDDTFIAMSDGAIYAGVGKTLNFGWQRENIVDFSEAIFDWSMSAKTISTMIVDECNSLYEGEPGDDTTIACVKIKKRNPVNLMIGPPSDPKDVNMMMNLFFSKEGAKIVCGGTTSTLAAQFLGKPVNTSIDYCDPEIPPIAYVEGIDLVTEGVITISRVVEYAKAYLSSNDISAPWANRKDGAAQIAQMLFEKATDINFFVGKAINPAHQNPNLPINFGIKIRLIQELAECLEKMGKHIKVSYF
ncbi:SpoIIE family protein phosphatase [Anaerofilum sp. BX8]|uniref:SpoIIE family protein phosphatase n=1 Tax=Anaerofilum hominis TaxID=2763016 RepID=A0A923I6N9_9FIRM|nr:SpoIIE family protein phosphatase [Anaerofilum hominis]MBC5580139.1 SpoIIE family protein phosphatase [Anaerofilum hominis]